MGCLVVLEVGCGFWGLSASLTLLSFRLKGGPRPYYRCGARFSIKGGRKLKGYTRRSIDWLEILICQSLRGVGLTGKDRKRGMAKTCAHRKQSWHR